MPGGTSTKGIAYDTALFERLNEEYRTAPLMPRPASRDPAARRLRGARRARSIASDLTLADRDVLELGCGHGWLAIALAEECDAKRVIGVDIVAREAWQQHRHPRLTLMQVDLSAEEEALPPESVDVVVSNAVLEHVHRPLQMLAALHRVLRPGGTARLWFNLHRGPKASHRYRDVFFPWPHLLFDDEVCEAWSLQRLGRRKGFSWVNRMTAAEYLAACREVGFQVRAMERSVTPIDLSLYRRHEDRLGRYPALDLETDFLLLHLERVAPGDAGGSPALDYVGRQLALDAALAEPEPAADPEGALVELARSGVDGDGPATGSPAGAVPVGPPPGAAHDLRAVVPQRLYHVDPRRIVLVTAGLNDPRRPAEVRGAMRAHEPAVLDGDWDVGAWGTTVKRFVDLDVYKAVHHRFVAGGEWEDTGFYRRVVGQMEAGTPKWGCTTEAEFRVRLEAKVERLYHRIAEEGFKSQQELGTKRPGNDIIAGIRRDGRLLFFDGRHRLAIALVLGVPSVPVNIAVRHREWVDFVEELKRFTDQKLKGRVYQRIDHPDLEDLPSRHGDERIGLLRGALGDRDWSGARLLDIGTHWGYMCQQMSGLGFHCVGVEHNRRAAEFARRLAPATESEYEVWEGSLLDHPGGRFEVVLAFSIFHHMLKLEERFERLKAFLGRLETDVMIFEPHDPVGSARQMEGAYRNYEPDEFAAFVAQHARLPNVQYVGTPDDAYRRRIYKLTP